MSNDANSSNDSVRQVFVQMDRATQLGRTPDGIAAAEEAVRLADSVGDSALGFQAREVLIENATFGGAPEKLLVAFSWCLAHADKDPNWDPDSFQAMSLLWRYKWVVGNTLDFPGISRVRILAMLDDFRKRSLAAGFNERAAASLRFTLERRMGHFQAAEEWRQRRDALDRDALADCHACEIDGVVAYLVSAGRYAEAIQEADAILDGSMSCAEIPHKTHASLLSAYWATARSGDAETSHVVGYRLIRTGRAFIRQHGDHISHLVRAGQLEKAVTLLRKHLPWALEAQSGEERFYFLVAARGLLHRLDQTGTGSIRLRLPSSLCPVAGKTTARTRELLTWIESSLRDLAVRFDERNQSAWFSNQLKSGNPGQSEAA